MLSFRRTNPYDADEITAFPSLNWIIIVRLISLLIVLGSIFFRHQFFSFNYDPQALLVVASVYFFISSAWLLVAKNKLFEDRNLLLGYLQFIVDLLLITLMVHFSGGLESRFAFLYIIPILAAGVFSLRALLFTSVSVFILYYGLVYFEYLGLVTPIFTPMNLDPYFSQVQLIRMALLFIIVTASSAFYFQRLKKYHEATMKLKDDFLFRTVHDLRSPTVAIKWLLEKYNKPEFQEKYPELQIDIRAMEDLLTRLLKLSRNLLLLAKGQKLEIPKEMVDLSVIIRSVLNEVQQSVAEKSIQVEYAPPESIPRVWASADLLKEAFSNILNNSMKYNKVGGKLEIQHSRAGDYLQTTILNTGLPISPENFKKLFTAYFRGDEEKPVEGTGLGLYITKKIVEQCGGTVGVESSSEASTVFFIKLPIATYK